MIPLVDCVYIYIYMYTLSKDLIEIAGRFTEFKVGTAGHSTSVSFEVQHGEASRSYPGRDQAPEHKKMLHRYHIAVLKKSEKVFPGWYRYYWLVVWLPFLIFPLILGCIHHPNWRSHIFQDGVAQPPTRLVRMMFETGRSGTDHSSSLATAHPSTASLSLSHPRATLRPAPPWSRACAAKRTKVLRLSFCGL